MKDSKIVCIGGGTGQSILLSGLKRYSSNLTAIVTVTDSGRSTGMLRRNYDIPAMGDIRNCLVSLAIDHPDSARDGSAAVPRAFYRPGEAGLNTPLPQAGL